MTSLDFIKQVYSGNASDAKEALNHMLSSIAFNKLDERKHEISKIIFNQDNDTLVSESKRLIHKYEPEGSVHTAKVYHHRDDNEYQTHFFKNGQHMGEGPVHYTDNKKDAIGTAKLEVDRMNINHKNE